MALTKPIWRQTKGSSGRFAFAAFEHLQRRVELASVLERDAETVLRRFAMRRELLRLAIGRDRLGKQAQRVVGVAQHQPGQHRARRSARQRRPERLDGFLATAERRQRGTFPEQAVGVFRRQRQQLAGGGQGPLVVLRAILRLGELDPQQGIRRFGARQLPEQPHGRWPVTPVHRQRRGEVLRPRIPRRQPHRFGERFGGGRRLPAADLDPADHRPDARVLALARQQFTSAGQAPRRSAPD
jgi:hypothetical protein